MTHAIPYVIGISDLQRQGKKAIEPALRDKRTEPVFVADRNDIIAVVVSPADYRRAFQKQNTESQFWLEATESALDFWNDPSNDIYETLL